MLYKGHEKKYKREYYQKYRKNPEKAARIKETATERRNSVAGKAAEKRHNKEFRNSKRGKEYINAYNKSEKRREALLKYIYNITLEQYNELFNKQKGKCAVCLKIPKDKKLSIDHDHNCCSGSKSCGKCVRGLLCTNCNLMLGLSNDSILIHQKAVQYLESYTKAV